MLSFVLMIAGISALLLILAFQPPQEISAQNFLENMLENQKVQTSGIVITEKQFGSSKIIILNNSIEIVCNSCPAQSLKNRSISIVGTISKYQNKTQIIAAEISIK